jgi:hypothetical protein
MVDRPIKKSDRKAPDQPSEPVQSGEGAPASNRPKPIKKGDRKDSGETRSDEGPSGRERGEGDRGDRARGKGRGKGRGKDDAPKAPMNPALVRGPRPVAKAAPAEEVIEEVAEETAVEEVAAEAAEETTVEEVAAEETVAEAAEETAAEEVAVEVTTEEPATEAAEATPEAPAEAASEPA